jgi:uncharacterized protein (DUF952 family)
MIFHITTQATWQTAGKEGSYQADSLKTEGFIHASTRSQVLSTANRFYRGQSGLLLLIIDDQRLHARVNYENLEGGCEQFPHIYGPLNLDAVVKAVPFKPQPDGTFKFPEDAEKE